MNEIDDLLKRVFTLYFEEEYYTDEVHKNKDYIKVCDDIEALQKRLTDILKPILKDNEIFDIIVEFENLYMLMSNIYRYYDFIQGLSLGITMTTVSPKINNPDFVEEMVKIINKTNI
jgi:hypothetical protein